MKNFKDIILSELTTSSAVPNIPAALPDGVIKAWKRTLDYDKTMKRKFSYYDVLFKTKNVTAGHKGHVTRAHNKLKSEIENNGLDVNETVKRLYKLHPPTHF